MKEVFEAENVVRIVKYLLIREKVEFFRRHRGVLEGKNVKKVHFEVKKYRFGTLPEGYQKRLVIDFWTCSVTNMALSYRIYGPKFS